MTIYQDLKAQHSKELNDFKGIFFAFSNKQFIEGLEKLGIEMSEAREKIASLPGGGYILKSRSKAFSDLFKKHNAEMKDFKADQEGLFNAIVYELGNHEYCITYDVTDALEALGLTAEDVPADILKKAKRQSLAEAAAFA